MKKNFLFNNLIILIIILLIPCIINETIFVYEHARHGARGPTSEYRSLFNNKTFYDEYAIHWDGDGELTLKGKMQHYILGIRNRYKYPNLLNYSNFDFNSNEILIHTTDSRRVKESAYNQLLGMFNPILKDNVNNDTSNLITKISEEKKFYYPPNYNVWKYKTTNKYHQIINEAELSIKYLEEEKKINLNNNSFLTSGIFNLDKYNKLQGTNITFTPYEKNRTYFKRTCLNHQRYINYNHRKKYQKVVKAMLEKNMEINYKIFLSIKKRNGFIVSIVHFR